jgi:4-hydroxy-tetrahydrodipicolinate synthase
MNSLETSHPFGGIYAATVCPMTSKGTIDEVLLSEHFSALAATEGIEGLLVNGHAGESAALDREELKTVISIARSTPGNHKVVAGINTERIDLAAGLAEDAAKAGANSVMVFPPFSWALGADKRVVHGHHHVVANASDLPLFLFQGSVNAGRTAYAPDTLAGLLEIEHVVGIKEGSWETLAYEATRRLTKRLRPDVAVMASGDEHLLTCFAIGSDGSLVSLAAVVPELIVALDRAVRAGELELARTLHGRIYELARLIYGTPGHLATLRLKTCLVLLGKLPCAISRSAITGLSPLETDGLRAALVSAGVL